MLVKIPFKLVHRVFFAIFYYFDPFAVFVFNPLFFNKCISQTLGFCKINVWTSVPSFTKNLLIHSKIVVRHIRNR